MPASLKDLKKKIKSVKTTMQTTKAMKLVSASKLGRAQTAVVQARPYAQALARLTGDLSGKINEQSLRPLMKANESKVAAVVVISSERGLCGGYNTNMFKQAVRTTEELESEGWKVHTVCLGKKAFQSLLRRRRLTLGLETDPGYLSVEDIEENPECLVSASPLSQIVTPHDKPTHAHAKRLADAYAELYTNGVIGKLVFVFAKFQSAIAQIPSTETLLPIQPVSANADKVGVEPLFEPSVSELLDVILPRYLATQVYQGLLEGLASEHGARMSAMDSATRNAKELERKLTITFQRARQAAITKELIEIISGAEAL